MPSTNPRYASWSKREYIRRTIKAQGLPCHICGQPIDYTLTTWIDPSDGKRKRHPLSFEVDEMVPVSKGGNPLDLDNCAPAHRICNQRRGNKMMGRDADDATRHDEAMHKPLPDSDAWYAI